MTMKQTFISYMLGLQNGKYFENVQQQQISTESPISNLAGYASYAPTRHVQ